MDWPADEVSRRPLASLVPYARNVRTHSETQIGQIAASIREWGWTMPVLVDEAGTIIAGHGRVLAAQRLGIGEAPVMVARGWSEAQRRAYVIADNKLTDNGGWDEALLRLELADLQMVGFDLAAAGFDPAELGDLIGPPAGPKASLADRFLIPPFSVLNAREGWWQDRKRAWLALGIQSELGRGENMLGMSDSIDAYMYDKAAYVGRLRGANTPHEGQGMADGLIAIRAREKAARVANATPSGSPLPAADYSKRQRGDGRGRPLD